MNQTKKIFIIAGGTGGHIFPAISIALNLQSRGWIIHWLGANDRMESILVPKYGINIECIEISRIRKKGINIIKTLWSIYKAIKKAKKIIQKYQPDIVLGMGGYISCPGIIAAWLCNIPIVIHEQNAIAGLTNKLLSKIAKCVLQAFPNTFSNAIVVGNPIRENILSISSPEKRFLNRKGAIRVLVLGGSQGANILNQSMPIIAAKTKKQLDILHQTGKGNKKNTKMLYQKKISHNFKYKIIEFIEDISKAYEWADIVICRSGALTVSEISTIGLPAIFIPFHHKDRQQYFNALHLEKIGAAKILHQKYLSTDKIPLLLDSYDRNKLLLMAKNAYNRQTINSTNKIAEIICKIANNKQLKL